MPTSPVTPAPTFQLLPHYLVASVNILVEQCHGANANWWKDLNTGLSTKEANNVPEKLMLVVSELGEAMEGHRKNLQDTHVPDFLNVEVELADAIIRICDLAGAKGYRLAEALAAKMQYNAIRADHKLEHRAGKNGKKY